MWKMKVRLLCIGLVVFISCGCKEYKKYEIYHAQMGTDFRIVYYDNSAIDGNELYGQVSATLDNLNQIFSDYLPDSEINTLCRDKTPGERFPISQDLWKVMRTAEKVSQQCHGAFDVTIAPLSKIWRRAIRRQELPDPVEIEKAKEKVDFSKIWIAEDEPVIVFASPEITLDMGGIAKGYALDRIALLLEDAGIKHYMIDGGGDLRIGDAPPGERGWKIRLLNDEIRLLKNISIATSGDRYKYIEVDGTRYSHLVDPRTGLGIRNGKTITVLGKEAIAVDAWASALSVLSEQERVAIQKSGTLVHMEVVVMD
jgi:thiamine biosynthesis lipoprotein